MSPIVAGIMELSNWTLYDQQHVPVGASLPGDGGIWMRFFERPWAQGYRDGKKEWGSPYLRTNSHEALKLPAPQRLVVFRVNAMFLWRDIVLPVSESQLYGRTVIQFSINRKIYWESPAWMCASPLAIFTTPKDAIARVEKETGIAWHQFGAQFGHDLQEGENKLPSGGLLIDYTQNFEVEASIEKNDDPDVVLAIHLDGPIARPIM